MGMAHASVDRSGCESPALDLQEAQSTAQPRLLQGSEPAQDGGGRGRARAARPGILSCCWWGARRCGGAARCGAQRPHVMGVAAGRLRRAGCRRQRGSGAEAGRPRRRWQQRRGTRPGPQGERGAVQALAGGCDSRRELARLDSTALRCWLVRGRARGGRHGPGVLSQMRKICPAAGLALAPRADVRTRRSQQSLKPAGRALSFCLVG